MFIQDSYFYPSPIRNFFFFHTFFCSHKFHKIENYFIFETPKKKIWVNFRRIIELFTQKFVTKLSKTWVWDPGSEIRKKPIPDPESRSRGQKGTRSRIRNIDFFVKFCIKILFCEHYFSPLKGTVRPDWI
jgi:hypothetical protein